MGDRREGGERLFCLSPMVGWFELIGHHNLVVKLKNFCNAQSWKFTI